MELIMPGRKSPPDDFSPAALVTRIRAGEVAAEHELVARYSRGVLVILRRLASEAGTLDDLYQEVFLRALEKIRAGDVREPERLSGFICGLTRNLAIDYFRRRAPDASLSDSEAGAIVADPLAGPLDRILQMEDDGCVRRLLSEMRNDRDRELLVRFYLAEDDKEQICAALSLTALQFNRVLHRARERFRELYQRAAGNRRAADEPPRGLHPNPGKESHQAPPVRKG